MNSSSPPRPRLALAVGIVGHRPNRLPDDPAKLASIAKEIGIVLDAIGRQANTLKDRYRAYFADEPPLISVVSALAEGSDRIAAWAAIARGPAAAAAHDAVFVLDAPLPFAAATYSDDFKSAASKAEFEDLRNRARAVLALPGERGAPQDKAYETVGVTVLNQADILLAVWDGGISAGRGGTTEMLDLAAQLGIPVIHIDAEAEAATRICWDGLSEPAASSSAFADLPCAGVATALPGLLDIMLRPPAEKPGPHGPRTFLQPPMRTERDWLLHYQQERLRRWNWYFTFTALRAVFGGCPLSQSKTDWRPSTSETLAAELAGFDVSLPPASRLQAQSILGRAYGWADAVGVRFGQVFRSAFVTNFVLAAFAVVAAALSLVWHDPGELLKMGPDIAPEAIAHHKLPFVAIELVFIGIVVLNTVIGRRKGWHRRWFEAREVAERLRIALPLWTLGMRPTTSFADEEPTWTGWYARAIVRQQGMKAGSLDAEGMQAACATLTALLKDQCGYHKLTAARMKLMDHNLEFTGLRLLGLTFFAALIFLIVVCAGVSVWLWVSYAVTALAAGLPALATATYGIRVIGDFEGVAHRSERTYLALDQIIKAIKPDALDLASLRARAQSAGEAMLGDVASWRLAAESRTLALPG